MKKSIIMITALGLTSQLYAKNIALEALTDAQVALKEKSLLSRQVVLKNKQYAWKKHKTNLIQNFKERYEGETHLGDKNYYGKLREAQHTQDFYTSLKIKDDEIEQNLISIKKELSELKRYFIKNKKLGYQISQND